MSSASPKEVLKISGVLQQYPWGEFASKALVAKLSGVAGLSADSTCAELWYGDHPRSPSPLVDSPNLHLAQALHERGEAPLPFLLKVLSIRKPLSIQAHPNLELAHQLHVRDPEHYPDANHKPEMGVALTPVRLLFGLRRHEELIEVLSALEPLHDHLKREISPEIEMSADLGRELLTALYRMERDHVAHLVAACRDYLSVRRTILRPSEAGIEATKLFLELVKDFSPDDVGLLVAPFLNVVTVEPLQGVFVPPNVPHAYLSGELVECMATSDNVVRAGLTNKFQDSDTLLKMLSFKAEIPKAEISQSLDGIEWYPRRCKEFQMGLMHGLPGVKVATLLPHSDGPMMVLALRGSVIVKTGSECTLLQPGMAAVELDRAGRTEVVLEQPEAVAVVAR